MLKHLPIPLIVGRLRLTNSEIVLLIAAIGLMCAALSQIDSVPATAIMLLVGVAAIVALVYERVSTRRILDDLAERLDTTGTADKIEVVSADSSRGVHEALNRAIQRMREHTNTAEEHKQPHGFESSEIPVSRAVSVAVLSVGLRQSAVPLYSGAYMETLRVMTTSASAAANKAGALLTLQGDAMLLLTFGVSESQPTARSMEQALKTATALAMQHPDLRFGLSGGAALLCHLPDLAPTVVGTPVEDALRLARMAVAWHEYTLLCAEPVALLARTADRQRTTLQLSHVGAPPLPVYALSLAAQEIVVSA